MSAPLSSRSEPPHDRYLEAAEEEWDSMSLGEKCEALDDMALDDVAGRLGLKDGCQYESEPFDEDVLNDLHELCRDHPGFTGWLDRKAAQLRQLAEEPEWEED